MTRVEIGGKRAAIRNGKWTGDRELVARLSLVMPRFAYSPNSDHQTAILAVAIWGGKIVWSDLSPNGIEPRAIY